MSRKVTNKYYFTVEGQTEKWYFEWLQNKINQCEDSKYKVSFDCKVEKNPIKRVKRLANTGKTTIYHISDYESSDDKHQKEFKMTIDNLSKTKDLGKQVTYKFGYSNLTFDLWIALHKQNCNQIISDRSKYINLINKGFNLKFNNFSDYKREKDFKHCLDKIELKDVIDAIKRAKSIMEKNEKTYTIKEYKKYTYYSENPSLMVWEPIEIILKDCGLLKK